MTMYRTQNFLLKPTRAQAQYFYGAVGLSRFAWNWALALSERYYRLFGKMEGYKRPSNYTLVKHWNKVKHRRFPWVLNYSKQIPQASIDKLHLAYNAAFARLKRGEETGFPKFRKKGIRDSFCVCPSSDKPLPRYGKRFRVSRLGLVKAVTSPRWPSEKSCYGRIKLVAGRWWLTLAYELPVPKILPTGRPKCGIDLGIKTLATISSGGIIEEVASVKPYAKAKRKLQRLQRIVSRRKKGSNRRWKAVRRLAKQHKRVADVRSNALHQLTARLTKVYGQVNIEDLPVKGLACGMLAGSIADMGFGEFRRQLEYKAEATGTKIGLVDRYFPSSKTCSGCGQIKADLKLSDRIYRCECGLVMDRDHNAARNIEEHGMIQAVDVELVGSSSRKGRGGKRRSV